MAHHRHLHLRDLEDLVNSSLDSLRSQGIPVTPQRREVITVLAGESDYLSAEELLNLVPGAHRATVYRTLELLISAGLVHSRSDGSATTFHLTGAREDSHLHLHCTRCQRTFVASPDCCQGPPDFDIDWHQSNLVGVCEQCKAH